LIVSFLVIGSCNYNLFKGLSALGPLSRPSAVDLLGQPAIGVLVVEGEIIDTIWAVNTLETFAENKHVKAVVLRINSPGGAVAPCQELYAALADFEKPVVVSMGSVAASGGLYLAVAGNPHIMALPGTITGSIGVILETLRFDEAMDKLGIQSEIIKSGPYKDMLSPFRPMRDDERTLLNAMVQEVWNQFVKDVAKGRPKLTEDQVRAMADGRVFNGEEALRLGLVDELGGYQRALDVAARLAGLPEDADPEIIYEDGRVPLIEQILGAKLSFLSPLEKATQGGPTMKFLYRPGLF
jgi:protease-4